MQGIFMCKLIGFILFWIAVGLIISLCMRNPLWKLFVAVVLLMIGYNMFCKR